MTLGGHGFKMVATYESVEAFLADDAEADVVILDLWIRTGVAPIRGLAAVEALVARGCRILIYSMDDRPAVLARLLAAGANGFVSKASSDDDLIDAIQRVGKGETVLTSELAALADQLESLGILKLTDIEVDVLRARARGMKVKAIASSTNWSEPTIERHVTSLNKKVRDVLVHVRLQGLDPSDSRPHSHLIARALGYGPNDLLVPPEEPTNGLLDH